MFLDNAEFYQQQGMVMARMAQQERRYGELDTTAVVQMLTSIIPRTPRDSVVSDALLTALAAIESDIDRQMKQQETTLFSQFGVSEALNALSIRK